MGSDEFAVLALDSSEINAEVLSARLQHSLDIHNARTDRPSSLSLSVGITCYDPESPCNLEALLERADKLMYQQKELKGHSPRPQGDKLVAARHPAGPD
jgi:diguanylate cyclase (GGDEF)-like protein